VNRRHRQQLQQQQEARERLEAPAGGASEASVEPSRPPPPPVQRSTLRISVRSKPAGLSAAAEPEAMAYAFFDGTLRVDARDSVAGRTCPHDPLHQGHIRESFHGADLKRGNCRYGICFALSNDSLQSFAICSRSMICSETIANNHYNTTN
jgi:hypothetical protein